jgi:HAE1 family hydrophobic/amphiphilic exporter-1/multidrug efflux pump
MSCLFLDRLLFSWVLAIKAMLAGILAIKSLPIALYPAIGPQLITFKP